MQETGQAGRDGQPSLATLLSQRDFYLLTIPALDTFFRDRVSGKL